MSKTKEQVSIEELQEQMAQAQEEKRKRYEIAYQELCEQHGFQMMPKMIIVPGQMPFAELIAVELRQK